MISDSITVLTLISIFLYSLRQIDLEVLRRLHRKVNVVPVIAKADTLTTHEVKKLKERILADIEEHEIQVACEKLWLGICEISTVFSILI